MRKVILIHANCRNVLAKGDYVFAANLAKDIIRLLRAIAEDTAVILVSAQDKVTQFENIYGTAINKQINVEGTLIDLSALEEFDAVENTVIAFIDANRCQHSPTEIVKKVISPESKFLFVGNMNRSAYSGFNEDAFYISHVQREQPGIYDSFHPQDILVGAAGLSDDRLGIPSITKEKDLPPLSSTQQALIPTSDYGFMYVNRLGKPEEYQLITQYVQLTAQNNYILVGNFAKQKHEVLMTYLMEPTLATAEKLLPHIQFHQSLPNLVMRKMLANATAPLVLTTGVTSTLEAMQDGKLTYYQNLACNAKFVTSYLITVQLLVTNDSSLSVSSSQMIIELSNLLFADKPLGKMELERTNDLLKRPDVSSQLVNINKTVIDNASGRIAHILLGFLGEKRSTHAQSQLAIVCNSLRKEGELSNPIHDQALRRAAAWGYLFELKVLIKSMQRGDLDKRDGQFNYSALHWAVMQKHHDCVRLLIKSGAALDPQDKTGETPLHKAIINGDKTMIRILLNAGASIDILNHERKAPADCTANPNILKHIRRSQIQRNTGRSM